ncbi:MAG: ABC transporter ATP-binding protein [Anaerolineae bacterium]|nr:ABC transporter ATP-binding protein [Anaerolineae bacterium]
MIVYDIEDVTKRYPKQPHPANNGISLQIQEAEIFGLLGDNGAGKTTLVRQMVNLLRPTSGKIVLFGQDIAKDPFNVPMCVGYMPQQTQALNNLSVGEALYFTSHLRGLSRADARRERDALLELWQMGHLRDKYSSRLSGGERRLLCLAVAMAGSLPVLILDEPTNDLAPQRRRLVWDVLGRINRERGTTIMFITHDAIEAEKVIQQVGIMRDGQLVAVGRPSDLKEKVDRKLRLEMFFSPGIVPSLPAEIEGHQLQPGRWIAWLDRDQVSAVLGRLELDQLDDFRLYSATLEDLYVHYTQPQV